VYGALALLKGVTTLAFDFSEGLKKDFNKLGRFRENIFSVDFAITGYFSVTHKQM